MTIQIDGVGRQLDELIASRRDGPGEKEVPVFVDDSGVRNRRYRRIGAFVGMICAVYAVVIVSTLLSGNSNAPWLPITGQNKDRPAGKVETSPLPADPAKPSTAPGVTAGPSADGTGAATAEPGTAAGPSAGPTGSASANPGEKPGTSPGPKPSGTAGKPGKPAPGHHSQAPGSGSSQHPGSPSPGAPSPSDSAPPVEPSESPVHGGTATVAQPPVPSSPVDQSPSPAGPPTPSSPESSIL